MFTFFIELSTAPYINVQYYNDLPFLFLSYLKTK